MQIRLRPAVRMGLFSTALVLFSGCANQMYVPIYEAGEDPDLRRPAPLPTTTPTNSKRIDSPRPPSTKPKGLDDQTVTPSSEPIAPKGIGDKPKEPVYQVVEPETVEKASMGKPRSKAVEKLLAQSKSYLEQANYRQSTQLAERALRIQPGLIDAYYLLASNKMRQGQWRSALQFANKGLQQRGRNSSFVEKLSEIARQAKAMME